MKYDKIKSRYCQGNMIRSLKDGVVRKYSGCLSLVGIDNAQYAYDSLNKDLVIYQSGKFAEIVEQGINDYEQHSKFIEKVQAVCKKLDCTRQELLFTKDYIKELS